MTVQRSSYMPGCMMSPSCLPIHNEFQYSRIHYCSSPRKRVRRWKNILRKFMRESKTLCRSKPISFQYDPVSYSQNFDEGCHLDEPRPGLQDVRWDLHHWFYVTLVFTCLGLKRRTLKWPFCFDTCHLLVSVWHKQVLPSSKLYMVYLIHICQSTIVLLIENFFVYILDPSTSNTDWDALIFLHWLDSSKKMKQ